MLLSRPVVLNVAVRVTASKVALKAQHTCPVTIEIERKFILSEALPAEQLGPGVRLRQGYLAEEDTVELRVRITSTDAALTVKAGSGMSRTEVEVKVSLGQAEALWPHTVGRRIDKTRYRVALDDPASHVAEVDVYGGPLTGSSVVEVEFSSETEASTFVPPSWFGRELSGQPGWSNASLARHGRPA